MDKQKVLDYIGVVRLYCDKLEKEVEKPNIDDKVAEYEAIKSDCSHIYGAISDLDYGNHILTTKKLHKYEFGFEYCPNCGIRLVDDTHKAIDKYVHKPLSFERKAMN